LKIVFKCIQFVQSNNIKNQKQEYFKSCLSINTEHPV
jgi:hypothetical protein